MSLLVSDAVVLHAFDYLETSRILRLLTRDAGVQSALARGARRPRSRFGTALDLFAEGQAQLQIRPGRDMQTLAGFDVVRARPALAADLARFAAASALAELTLRAAAHGEWHPTLYTLVVSALDSLERVDGFAVGTVGIGAAWRLLAEVGLSPALDYCVGCHAPVPPEENTLFSAPGGGVLCGRCGRNVATGRRLPPDARAALRAWLISYDVTLNDSASVRAHQRLLREFFVEHLGDGRPLRAFEAWERETWAAA